MTVLDRRYSVAEGQAVKTPCAAATTANITLSGLQTIDGVALVEGDRMLIMHQADATENGIYNVSSGNWTRAVDADSNSDWANSTYVAVATGATNGGVLFHTTAADPIVLGTSNLTFVGFGIGDLEPIADTTIVSNISGASAPPAANTLTAILDAILGSTVGSFITRTVNGWVARLKGDYSPEDFGAADAENAAVDDAPFVQLALNAIASAGKGTLRLRRWYYLQSQVTFADASLCVRGGFGGTGFKVKNATGGLAITINQSTAGAIGIALENFDVVNATGVAVATGISVVGTAATWAYTALTQLTISKVRLLSSTANAATEKWTAALYLKNVSNPVIDNITIYQVGNTTGYGIQVDNTASGGTFATYGLDISSSDIQGGARGIYITGSIEGVLIDRPFIAGSEYGIYSNGGGGIGGTCPVFEVRGGSINAKRTDIYLVSWRAVSVQGVDLYHGVGTGDVDAPVTFFSNITTELNISGNKIAQAVASSIGAAHIELDKVVNAVISDNVIEALVTGTAGIVSEDSGARILVSGNVIRDTTTTGVGFYIVNTTGFIETDNMVSGWATRLTDAGGNTGLVSIALPSGAAQLTFPSATDTLVGKATTDTLTNKTFDTAGAGNVLKINGTQISDKTGTGKAVLDTSPTISAPTISGHPTIEGVTTTGATGTGKAVFDTSPTISGAALNGLTNLAIRDTSAAFDVTLAGTSSPALSAGRTMTLDMGNVAHTVKLGTTANTITFPNAASGTVPFLNLAQTFSALQTFTASITSNVASGVVFSGNGSASNANTYFSVASATASFTAGVDTDNLAYFYTAGAFKIFTAGVEHVRVSAAGGLSVNTTTDPGAGAILANASIKATTYLQPGSYTVAGLPAGVTGAMVWASNCRVFNGAGVQEGAGSGTGGLVTYNGTAWKIAGTNITAIA